MTLRCPPAQSGFPESIRVLLQAYVLPGMLPAAGPVRSPPGRSTGTAFSDRVGLDQSFEGGDGVRPDLAAILRKSGTSSGARRAERCALLASAPAHGA